MKKILVVSSNSIHLFNFYNLINSYFDHIGIVTDSINEKYNYRNIVLYKYNFSIKKPFQFIISYFKLKKLIKTNKYSIIHIQQITTAALLAILASKKSKIPIVATAWGSDILLISHRGYFYKKLVKYVLKNVDIVTADSEFVIQEMNKLTKQNIDAHLVILTNLHSTPKYFPKKSKIIYSNRLLTPLYRIDLIINAFEKFIKDKQYEEWKLIIAGQGNERHKLEKIVREKKLQNQIEFVGWQSTDKNNEYYQKALIYISIPISDGTPTSLLEAMSYGCIPIVSDLPVYYEWIENNVNGLIVNDLNSNFIEKALKLNPIKVWEINRNIIEKKATIDVNKSKLEQIYNKLLQTK